MRTLLFFFLLASVSATGQINPSIQNTKTSKHVNIPGTRVYIIPPPGFSVAKRFIGLQKGETALLNVYDLVGGNFYTNAKTFSKTAFETQGLKVFDYQEIKVNDYPAKYLSGQGDPAAKTHVLVFGDTTFSTMIMAPYGAQDDASGQQIVAALNSIYYDKEKKIDPFETAAFSLDDKSSKFKFFQYAASLYIYTPGGRDNSKTPDEPMMIVTQIPMDASMTTTSVADMMMGKMQQYGLTASEIKNVSTARLNGYNAYEAEVFGQLKDKPGAMYICVVSTGEQAVVIQGIAHKDLEAAISDFKQLAHTVKVK